MKGLKIVILECPYDSWSDKRTQFFFNRMISLKLKGYQAKYPYGILPLEASDMVATHLLLCIEKNRGLEVIGGFRSLSAQRAKIHRLPFPVLPLLKKSPDHLELVKNLLEDGEKRDLKMTYNSGLTVEPNLHISNLDEYRIIRQILMAMDVFYNSEQSIHECIAIVATHMKMDKTLSNLGYQFFEKNGKALPNFIVPSYFNAEVNLMHLTGGYSEDVKQRYLEYSSLWEERIVVAASLEDHPQEKIVTKKAA